MPVVSCQIAWRRWGLGDAWIAEKGRWRRGVEGHTGMIAIWGGERLLFSWRGGGSWRW